MKRFKFNIDGSVGIFSTVTLFGFLKVVVGVIYFRPSLAVEKCEKVLAKLDAIVELNMPVLLLGDFNFRHPQLGDSVHIGTSNANRFISFLNNHSLSVLNTIHCWGMKTRKESILDLAITTHPHLFSLKIDFFPLGSDHSTLTVDVKLPSPPPAGTPPVHLPRWSTKDANWELYHNSVQNSLNGQEHLFVSWRSCPSTPKQIVVDKLAQMLTAPLLECADLSMKRCKPHEPFQLTSSNLHAQSLIVHQLRVRKRRLKSR
jgi:hypothetical protein